jgi:hypothetical protein
VRTTATASTQIVQLSQASTVGYAEFDHAVSLASGHVPPPPLPGDRHGLSLKHEGIAILNSQYDIYLVEPVAPAPFVLVAYETGSSEIILAVLEDRSLPGRSASSDHRKTSLTSGAASAMGVVVSDIHVL